MAVGRLPDDSRGRTSARACSKFLAGCGAAPAAARPERVRRPRLHGRGPSALGLHAPKNGCRRSQIKRDVEMQLVSYAPSVP